MKLNCIKLYLFFILIFFTFNSYAQPSVNCPRFSNEQFLTKNNNGKSSYANKELTIFFKQLENKKLINLNNPILDVGAGYGSATYELIQLGAKKIYINDLDEKNLFCINNHLNSTKTNHHTKLIYLSGDISSNNILKKIPSQKIGFVYAQNVIQFLSYNQLMNFVKSINQKVSKNGIVVLIYENPYSQKLNLMIRKIFEAYKANPKMKLENIVEYAYKHVAFKGDRYCSYYAFKHAPTDLRLPGFPCEIPTNNIQAQLLEQNVIIELMNAAGFKNIKNIKADTYHDQQGTVLLLFSKEKNVTSEYFDSHLKNWISEQLKWHEQ